MISQKYHPSNGESHHVPKTSSLKDFIGELFPWAIESLQRVIPEQKEINCITLHVIGWLAKTTAGSILISLVVAIKTVAIFMKSYEMTETLEERAWASNKINHHSDSTRPTTSPDLSPDLS